LQAGRARSVTNSRLPLDEGKKEALLSKFSGQGFFLCSWRIRRSVKKI